LHCLFPPQKIPLISGSFAENDLQLKTSYAFSPPSILQSRSDFFPLYLAERERERNECFIPLYPQKHMPVCVCWYMCSGMCYVLSLALSRLLETSTPCGFEYIYHFWWLCLRRKHVFGNTEFLGLPKTTTIDYSSWTNLFSPYTLQNNWDSFVGLIQRFVGLILTTILQGGQDS